MRLVILKELYFHQAILRKILTKTFSKVLRRSHLLDLDKVIRYVHLKCFLYIPIKKFFIMSCQQVLHNTKLKALCKVLLEKSSIRCRQMLSVMSTRKASSKVNWVFFLMMWIKIIFEFRPESYWWISSEKRSIEIFS